MDPRINVVTLAVGDLERSLAFYRDGLGLSSDGVTGTSYPGDETNAAGAVVMEPAELSSPYLLVADLVNCQEQLFVTFAAPG